MSLVTSSSSSNNHNLYFSKDELSKILNLYSKGVSRGEWKDYSIGFHKNNAFFYIYKHTLASPECILNKTLEKKRRRIFYKLNCKYINRKFENIDSLISAFAKTSIKIID